MYNKETTAMFIGHRECYEMDQEQLEREILRLIENGVTTFLSGGMGRFDAACEETVERLKVRFPHIKLYIVMPYPKFRPKHIIGKSQMIFPDGLEPCHPKAAIQKRNRYMADRASYAICYVHYPWGGAAQTLKYVKTRSIPCIFIQKKTPPAGFSR